MARPRCSKLAISGWTRAREAIKANDNPLVPERQVADALGLPAASHIYAWEQVPAERVLEVSRVADLPIWVIRPDIFSKAEIRRQMRRYKEHP